MAKREKPLPLGPFVTAEPEPAPLDETMPRVVRCPLCYGTQQGRGRPCGRHGQRWILHCRGCGHEWTKLVKIQNQCPICWQTLGGVGRQTSSHGTQKFFACDTCGQTWTALVKQIVDRIVYQVVDRIEYQQPETFDERDAD